MYRQNARHVSYEELTGRSFDVVNTEGSSSSASKKKRTVSVQDEDEDGEGGGSSLYEGIANPEEAEEDDRFFGDGLTSDQKDILDYVDDIDPEEVKKKSNKEKNSHVIRNQEALEQQGPPPASLTPWILFCVV
jgi:beta-catenin-like protein 1